MGWGGGGETQTERIWREREGVGVDGKSEREGQRERGMKEREDRGNETNRERQLDNETDIQTAAEKD